jgi:hypothetical protein
VAIGPPRRAGKSRDDAIEWGWGPDHDDGGSGLVASASAVARATGGPSPRFEGRRRRARPAWLSRGGDRHDHPDVPQPLPARYPLVLALIWWCGFGDGRTQFHPLYGGASLAPVVFGSCLSRVGPGAAGGQLARGGPVVRSSLSRSTLLALIILAPRAGGAHQAGAIDTRTGALLAASPLTRHIASAWPPAPLD